MLKKGDRVCAVNREGVLEWATVERAGEKRVWLTTPLAGYGNRKVICSTEARTTGLQAARDFEAKVKQARAELAWVEQAEKMLPQLLETAVEAVAKALAAAPEGVEKAGGEIVAPEVDEVGGGCCEPGEECCGCPENEGS